MMPRRWRRRVKQWLFAATLALAVALAAAVLVAPLIDGGGPVAPDAGSRTLALFSRDVTMRRTALASALGLAVTAFAFFRPPGIRPPRAPNDVVGA